MLLVAALLIILCLIAGSLFAFVAVKVQQNSFAADVFITLLPLILPAFFFTFFFIPGAISMLFALPGVLLFRHPKRILVLRKFGRKDSSRGLKRILRRHISLLGHIYTLSDADIRVPLLVRIPLLLTQVAFFHFGRRRLSTPRDVDELLAMMSLRTMRNLNWYFSWGKIFPTDSTDEIWQDAITRILDGVDAVILDVSAPSASIEWEVQLIKKKGLLNCTIFLTTSRNNTASSIFLESQGVSAPSLIHYDAEDAGPDLRKATLAAIGNRTPPDSNPFPSKKIRLLETARIIGPFIWIFLGGLFLHHKIYEEKVPVTPAAFATKIESLDQRQEGLRQLQTFMDMPRNEASDNLYGSLINYYILLFSRNYDLRIHSPGERWLSAFDKRLMPLLTDIYGSNAADDTIIRTIASNNSVRFSPDFWTKALSLCHIDDPAHTKEIFDAFCEKSEVWKYSSTIGRPIVDLNLSKGKQEALSAQVEHALRCITSPSKTIKIDTLIKVLNAWSILNYPDPVDAIIQRIEAIELANGRTIPLESVLHHLATTHLNSASARSELNKSKHPETSGSYLLRLQELLRQTPLGPKATEGILNADDSEIATVLVETVKASLNEPETWENEQLTLELIRALAEGAHREAAPFLYELSQGQPRTSPGIMKAAYLALSSLAGWSTPKTQVPQTKPQISVMMLGSIDHGKTTLSTAILTVAQTDWRSSEFASTDSTNNSVPGGVSISTAYLKYKTDKRHYIHYDPPGHSDLIKSLIRGQHKSDAAILVVAADTGPTHLTREQLHLAREVGIDRIVAFLNKVDLEDDEEILELLELEIRDLLTRFEYDGDATPVIRGSALKALEGDKGVSGIPSVLRLLSAMDTWYKPVTPAKELPLIAPVVDVLHHFDSTLVTAKIDQGVLQQGDLLQAAGLQKTEETVIREIMTQSGPTDIAEAGDVVGLLLSQPVEKGQTLAKVNSLKTYTQFKAVIYLAQKEEGGRHTPIFRGYSTELCNTGVKVTITFPPGVEMIMPGDFGLEVVIEPEQPLALYKGMHFSFCEGKRIIAYGIITSLLE